MRLKVFHTQANRNELLSFPEITTKSDNWLGDGFYFWQDLEFAEWWGDSKKCQSWNKSRKYDIYNSILDFSEDAFIDTVFNEIDYYNFIKTIEKFSKAFQRKIHKKPSLKEFILFIKKFGIWENINVIRFQDIPENNLLVEVKGFYYKKRIQIRVNRPEIISTFDHFSTKDCIN
jgi:hypothetical protein